MTPKERRDENRVHIIVLIALFAYFAFAIPARLAENRDAEYGAAVRAVLGRK